ncbi:MAG TPA: polysaccharide biosynthesis C-terminal domain-containing protein [Thermoplasmata archaeon]|jgi:O-antigen/teichoic acid export membrane protein
MGGLSGSIQRLAGNAWGQVKKPLYRNAFFIMFSSVIGSGLGFFFWLVVARFFKSTNDVGWAVTLFQTVSFVATLGLLGLGVALVRFLPETEKKVPLVNACLTIVGMGAILLTVVFLVGLPLWAKDFTSILESPAYLIAILVTSVALAFAPILDQVAIAMRRADVFAWRTLVFSLLKIPLAIVFAMFALTSGRIGIFMAIALAFVASTAVEGLIFLPRILPGFRPWPEMDFAHVGPMVRFSLGNYAATSIGGAGAFLLPLLIVNVLGPDAGTEQAAFFYIATVVAGLLYIIPNATFTSFYAEASQRDANRPADERKAILLSLALLAPGVAVLWIFAFQMLTWFGEPAYAAGAVGALHILVFASVPAFLNSILGTRVRIRKETRPLIIGAAISTVVTLGAGYLLLLAYGIDGLAVAYVLGMAASTPYYWLVARKPFEAEPLPPVEPTPAGPPE